MHDFGVYLRFFMYARHDSDVVREEPRYCIVEKIQDGCHFFKVNKYINVIGDIIQSDSWFKSLS